MTTIFREKIREKIADEALQVALDNNHTRRIQGRLAAFASLPNGPERRQKAHAIRAEVIEHLDQYLEQFIGNAKQNGLIVHRAKDEAEAVQMVLGIIRAAPRKGPSDQPVLVAKAKSMVSEEIGINHALEAAGHRVIETDLGEYIVQLRQERPAHIITPAVHLRRGQVGELFQEKLGLPYTEDIPTLTLTARSVMREVFLNADIGISGVNFAVAETGGLTLVTNEGNGRMCTTLPPTHIALMGMERLLPTLDDLALFLSLLPRSATGQKLSVYTQIIHQPLAGQQRHLVIVDNGRSQMRASGLHEGLYCIRCGACLNACPIFREIGGHAYVGSNGVSAPYPGPIGSVVSPGLLGENFSQLAQASTLCGACKDACPVDIDLPKMLLRIRAGQLPVGPRSEGQGLPTVVKLGLTGFIRAAMLPGLFAFGQRLLGWLAARLPDFLPAPAMTGWGFSKDFPKPAAKPFRARFNSLPAEKAAELPRQQVSAPAAEQPPAAAPQPAEPLITRFVEEASAVGGRLSIIAPDQVAAQVSAFLRERSIDRVQMWDNVPGLKTADLTAAGIRVEQPFSPEILVGITGALAGIAETGSLVIPGGAGQPLTASLVPEIHLAILRASDILPSLEAAIRLPEVAATPSTVLVTGPSRTADIEMTLTVGVHGPKELHIFVVDDAPRSSGK